MKTSLTSVPSEMTIVTTFTYGFRKKSTYLQTILLKEQDTCLTMTAHPLKPQYV